MAHGSNYLKCLHYIFIALLDQVLLNKFKVIIVISLLEDPWFGRRNSWQPSCLGMRKYDQSWWIFLKNKIKFLRSYNLNTYYTSEF